MPAAVAVPLITSAVGAGASLIGGGLASSAASKAAKIKADSDLAAGDVVQGYANAGAKEISDSTVVANSGVDASKTSANALLSSANDANIARNAPTLAAGQQATSDLGDLSKAPGFQWDESTDPGYQFRLQQGVKALQNSGAARGSGMGGAALKGITNYAQNYASSEYNNSFNRFQTNRTNQAGMYSTLINSGNQAAGLDQQSTDFSSGLQSSNDMDAGKFIGSNTMAGTAAATGMQLQGAQARANAITGAGTANASGVVGSANAWNGALTGVAGAGQNALLYTMLSGGKTPPQGPSPLGGAATVYPQPVAPFEPDDGQN